MEVTSPLSTAIAAARGARPAFGDLTDDQLLGSLAAVEELGRIADGLRLSAAAEVQQRSRPVLGEERFSFTPGVRDGAELVRQVAASGTRR